MADRPPPGTPTPPVELAGDPGRTPHLPATRVDVSQAVIDRLGDVCRSVTVEDAALDEAGRDWWPISLKWALAGQPAGRPHVVASPATVTEVSDVLRVANESRLPVTTAAGRSGVCGGSVPVHGGLTLDLTALSGIRDVDAASLVVDVGAGTFGDAFEAELQDTYGVTVGHWPQSMSLSTVGGWLACRGAGQYSTRYGKIEDMVHGLDVVLADGTTVATGGSPRAATGPDLTQLFVGSEGTLGVITGARLRAHPRPEAEQRAAYGFSSFAAGLEACRRILHRGATPAVLRLYDHTESKRNFESDTCVLLVLDEGDDALIGAVMRVVDEECVNADALDVELVEGWMHHRNDVSALSGLYQSGIIVDTMEVAGPWRILPALYESVVAAISAVDGTLAASSHQSHSYSDGACLYFTFAGRPDHGDGERYYRQAWEAGTRAVLAGGASLSHHHGVGLLRGHLMPAALGDAFGVLVSVKRALDPNGILNPGKLGLDDPFGDPGWTGWTV